jgi:hypothetical protein
MTKQYINNQKDYNGIIDNLICNYVIVILQKL